MAPPKDQANRKPGNDVAQEALRDVTSRRRWRHQGSF
jgi:hypothetical protein